METFDWYTWVILPLIVFFARAVRRGAWHIAHHLHLARQNGILRPCLALWRCSSGSASSPRSLGAQAISPPILPTQRVRCREIISACTSKINWRSAPWSSARSCRRKFRSLAMTLKEKGLGVTSVSGMGSHGPVKLIYTVVMRKELTMVAEAINPFIQTPSSQWRNCVPPNMAFSCHPPSPATLFGMLARRKSK
jgi:hypothetical protein